MRCPGALHFIETNATAIRYGLQTNSTPVSRRGHYEDPTFKFQIPLQIAAEREIARSLIGGIKFHHFFSCLLKNLQCYDVCISACLKHTSYSWLLRSKLQLAC